MVTRPHRNALLVEDRGQIVGVDIAVGERDCSSAGRGCLRAVDGQLGHLFQAFERVGGQFLIMARDPVHADPAQILEGGA